MYVFYVVNYIINLMNLCLHMYTDLFICIQESLILCLAINEQNTLKSISFLQTLTLSIWL